MKQLIDILVILDSRMQRPGIYGPFHLIAFALTLIIAAAMCIGLKNVRDRAFRRIMFVFWLILLLFETYKQINFSFNYNAGDPYWDYQWYAFPFQSCSAVLYVLPFIFLSRQGSAVRRAACSYLSFYSFFAGFAVMFYPSTVFTDVIGINIQTMVWHGSQIIIGRYLIAYNRRELNFRYFASGIPVFLILLAVATALNLIAPRFTSETFNMFFISPYFPSTLPILSIVWEKAPWPVFMLIYIIGFTLSAFLVYSIARAIIRGSKKNPAAEKKAA